MQCWLIGKAPSLVKRGNRKTKVGQSVFKEVKIVNFPESSTAKMREDETNTEQNGEIRIGEANVP